MVNLQLLANNKDLKIISLAELLRTPILSESAPLVKVCFVLIYNIHMKRLLFNLWYFRKPPWDTGISPPELMEFIQNHPHGKALDLGCGTGTNVITLAQYGWQAVGVDFASKAIRIARRKAHQLGLSQKVNFLASSVTSPEVSRLKDTYGAFNLILDIGCFHNLPSDDRPKYANTVTQLLDAQGTYLLYVHCKQAGGTGMGVTEEALKIFYRDLKLIKRIDSQERSWSSAWLSYQKAIGQA